VCAHGSQGFRLFFSLRKEHVFKRVYLSEAGLTAGSMLAGTPGMTGSGAVDSSFSKGVGIYSLTRFLSWK